MPSLSAATTTTLFLALATNLANASFIIANTTSCYGEFFLGICHTNVQVISPGVAFDHSFTCDKLYHAQTSRYIQHNEAGPHSDNFTSTSDVCGAGRLFFQRNDTETSTNGTFDIFKGSDASSGDSIGQCEYTGTNVTESRRRCSQLMGTIFYIGAYRCNTTVCGEDDDDDDSTSTSTSSSSSSSSMTSTTSASSSSSSSSATTSSITTTTTTTDSSTTESSASSTATATSVSSSSTKEKSSSSSETKATTTKAKTTSTSTAEDTTSTTTSDSTTTADSKRAVKRWNG